MVIMMKYIIFTYLSHLGFTTHSVGHIQIHSSNETQLVNETHRK